METIQKIEEYLIRHRHQILYAIILAIISYGYELFNFSMSIDEELYSIRSAVEAVDPIALGRWGTYLLNIIFTPATVLPYFPFLIALVAISLSGVLFVNSIMDNNKAKWVFLLIYISYPLHSYYLAFNFVNFCFAIGGLLSVLAYLLAIEALQTKTVKSWGFFGAILFLVFAMSVYQGVFPVFVFFVVAYLLRMILIGEVTNFKTILNSTLFFLAIYIVAFIGYSVIDIVFRFLDNGMPERNYLKSLNSVSNGSLIDLLVRYAKQVVAMFSGLYFYGTFWTVLSFFLYLFLSFRFLKNLSNRFQKSWAFVFLNLLMIAPFLVMLFIGAPLPLRTFLAFPFAIAILWLYSYINLNRTLQSLFVALALLVFVNNTYFNTRLFYAANVSWQADKEMANRIIERIYTLDLPPQKEKVPVEFIGHYQHHDNNLFYKADVFGTSFFEQDLGNNVRIHAFFKTLGINELQRVGIKRLQPFKKQIEQMPSWPHKGSVRSFKNIVVVKLSDDDELLKEN